MANFDNSVNPALLQVDCTGNKNKKSKNHTADWTSLWELLTSTDLIHIPSLQSHPQSHSGWSSTSGNLSLLPQVYFSCLDRNIWSQDVISLITPEGRKLLLVMVHMVKRHFSHSVLCIYFTFLWLYILLWPIFNEVWHRGRPIFFLLLSFIIQTEFVLFYFSTPRNLYNISLFPMLSSPKALYLQPLKC